MEDSSQVGMAKEIDISNLVLCKKHKPGSMVPRSCTTCAAAIGLFKDKAVIENMVLNSKASSSSYMSRYNRRCDTVDPTLVLSPDTIQNALNIFTKGVFKDQRQWTQVIKEFLCLPAEQHDLLNLDIQNEDLLNKFKKEQRFQSLFKYGSEIAKGLKHLRLSQRPLFSLMERVNDDMQTIRDVAEQVGISFPDAENAPPCSGVHVPRNGRDIRDSLQYAGYQGIFPVPDLSMFTEELSMGSAQALILVFESYRANMMKIFMRVYDLYRSNLNATNDFLIFHFDMHSHVDSEFRELIRERFASLFVKDIKSEVIARSSSRKMKSEKAQGLFSVMQ